MFDHWKRGSDGERDGVEGHRGRKGEMGTMPAMKDQEKLNGKRKGKTEEPG